MGAYVTGDLDRIKGALETFIRGLFPTIDYLARYEATAVAQNSDGTLEVTVDDTRFPGLSHVPIRYGVPGVSAVVNSGARVLLGFAGGDPSKPQVEIWESASVAKFVIAASEVDVNGGNVNVTATNVCQVNGNIVELNGGTLPIARLTDQAGPFKIVGPGNISVLG